MDEAQLAEKLIFAVMTWTTMTTIVMVRIMISEMCTTPRESVSSEYHPNILEFNSSTP